MKFIKLLAFAGCLFYFQSGAAQTKISKSKAKSAMMRATRFMVEKVSNNGGYVAHYLPDMSILRLAASRIALLI